MLHSLHPVDYIIISNYVA